MRLAIACLLLLAAAPAGAADPPSSPPDTVHLEFGWKPGLEFSATSTRTRTRVTDRRESSSVTSLYTIGVAAGGKNLRIGFTKSRLDPKSASGLTPEQLQMVPQLAEMLPDYAVTPAGDFVEIVGLAAFRKRFRSLLFGLTRNADTLALEQALELVTSDAFLNSQVGQQWNGIVGAWAGSDLELGSQYTVSRREPVALLPGEEILMDYTFTATRRDTCSRRGKRRGCAELVMRSAANPEDAERVIRSFLSKLTQDQASKMPVLRSLQVESLIRLVTEPDGMIPHSYHQTKTVRATVAVEGRDQPVEQIDVTEVRYSHP